MKICLMYRLYRRRLIQICRDETLLKKYDVKANDAILAEEKHMGLYDDLIQNHDAKLIAGGAAQNTARGAQVCIFPQSETPWSVITCPCLMLLVLVHPPR
jgi:hypothetical protein